MTSTPSAADSASTTNRDANNQGNLKYSVDWKIWPTSVTVDFSNLDRTKQLKRQRHILPGDERNFGSLSAFLGGGDSYTTHDDRSSQTMSRHEVILDLLEPAEEHARKVHVEDFLWSGSGKNIHLQKIC